MNNFKRICMETAGLDVAATSKYIREDEMGIFSHNEGEIHDTSLTEMAMNMCALSMKTGCEHCMCESCCSATKYRNHQIVYGADGFKHWLESNCYYPEDVKCTDREICDEYAPTSYYHEMRAAGLRLADFI